MAENRYNVDDILREVKEKRAREERAAQPEKRATTTTEDLLRQLDAAQTGLSRAAGAASERPAPAKTAPQPVKKAEPFPGELLQKTEAPAAPAPAAEPEFKWEEPKRPEPVMQPEEWTPPKNRRHSLPQNWGRKCRWAGRFPWPGRKSRFGRLLLPVRVLKP